MSGGTVLPLPGGRTKSSEPAEHIPARQTESRNPQQNPNPTQDFPAPETSWRASAGGVWQAPGALNLPLSSSASFSSQPNREGDYLTTLR
jgi:hypothetical protein